MHASLCNIVNMVFGQVDCTKSQLWFPIVFSLCFALVFVYFAIFKPNKYRRSNFSLSTNTTNNDHYNPISSYYHHQIHDITPLTAKRISSQSDDIIASLPLLSSISSNILPTTLSSTSQTPTSANIPTASSALPTSHQKTSTKDSLNTDLIYIAINDATGHRYLYQINNTCHMSSNQSLLSSTTTPLPQIRVADLLTHHIAKHGFFSTPSLSPIPSTLLSNSPHKSTSIIPNTSQNSSKSTSANKTQPSRRASLPPVNDTTSNIATTVHINPASDTIVSLGGKYCLVFFPTSQQQMLCQTCPCPATPIAPLTSSSNPLPNSTLKSNESTNTSTANTSTVAPDTLFMQHNVLNSPSPCRSGLCTGHGFSFRSGNRRIPLGMMLSSCIPTKADLQNPSAHLSTSHFTLFDPTLPSNTSQTTQNMSNQGSKTIKWNKNVTANSSASSSSNNLVRGGLMTSSGYPIYELYIEEDVEWALLSAQLKSSTPINNQDEPIVSSTTTSSTTSPSTATILAALPLQFNILPDDELSKASNDALVKYCKQLAAQIATLQQTCNDITSPSHPLNTTSITQSPSHNELDSASLQQLKELQYSQVTSKKKEKQFKTQIEDLTRQVDQLRERTHNLHTDLSHNEMKLSDALNQNDTFGKEVRDLKIKTQRLGFLQERSDRLTDIDAENEQLKFKLGNLTKEKDELLKKLNEKKEKDRLKLEAMGLLPPSSSSSTHHATINGISVGSNGLIAGLNISNNDANVNHADQHQIYDSSHAVSQALHVPNNTHHQQQHSQQQHSHAAIGAPVSSTVSVPQKDHKKVSATLIPNDKDNKHDKNDKTSNEKGNFGNKKHSDKDISDDRSGRESGKKGDKNTHVVVSTTGTTQDGKDKSADKGDKNASKTAVKATLIIATSVPGDASSSIVASQNATHDKKGLKVNEKDTNSKKGGDKGTIAAAAAAATASMSAKDREKVRAFVSNNTMPLTPAAKDDTKSDKTKKGKNDKNDSKVDKTDKSNSAKGGEKGDVHTKGNKDSTSKGDNKGKSSNTDKGDEKDSTNNNTAKKGTQKGSETTDKDDKNNDLKRNTNAKDGKNDKTDKNNRNKNNVPNLAGTGAHTININSPSITSTASSTNKTPNTQQLLPHTILATHNNPSSRHPVTMTPLTSLQPVTPTPVVLTNTNPHDFYDNSMNTDYHSNPNTVTGNVGQMNQIGDNFTDYGINGNGGYANSTEFHQYSILQQQQAQQQQLLWQQQQQQAQQQQQQQQLLWQQQQQQMLFYRLQNDPQTITTQEVALAQHILQQEQQQAMLLQQILLQQQQQGQPLNQEYLELVRLYSTRYSQLQFYTQYVQHQELLQKQHELRQREVEIQQQIELQQQQIQIQSAHRVQTTANLIPNTNHTHSTNLPTPSVQSQGYTTSTSVHSYDGHYDSFNSLPNTTASGVGLGLGTPNMSFNHPSTATIVTTSANHIPSGNITTNISTSATMSPSVCPTGTNINPNVTNPHTIASHIVTDLSGTPNSAFNRPTTPGIKDIVLNANAPSYTPSNNQSFHNNNTSTPTILGPTLSTADSSRSGFHYHPPTLQNGLQHHQDSPSIHSLSVSPSHTAVLSHHNINTTTNNNSSSNLHHPMNSFTLTPSINQNGPTGQRNQHGTPGYDINNPFHPANTDFMSAFQPLTPTISTSLHVTASNNTSPVVPHTNTSNVSINVDAHTTANTPLSSTHSVQESIDCNIDTQSPVSVSMQQTLHSSAAVFHKDSNEILNDVILVNSNPASTETTGQSTPSSPSTPTSASTALQPSDMMNPGPMMTSDLTGNRVDPNVHNDENGNGNKLGVGENVTPLSSGDSILGM